MKQLPAIFQSIKFPLHIPTHIYMQCGDTVFSEDQIRRSDILYMEWSPSEVVKFKLCVGCFYHSEEYETRPIVTARLRLSLSLA